MTTSGSKTGENDVEKSGTHMKYNKQRLPSSWIVSPDRLAKLYKAPEIGLFSGFLAPINSGTRF